MSTGWLIPRFGLLFRTSGTKSKWLGRRKGDDGGGWRRTGRRGGKGRGRGSTKKKKRKREKGRKERKRKRKRTRNDTSSSSIAESAFGHFPERVDLFLFPLQHRFFDSFIHLKRPDLVLVLPRFLLTQSHVNSSLIRFYPLNHQLFERPEFKHRSHRFESVRSQQLLMERSDPSQSVSHNDLIDRSESELFWNHWSMIDFEHSYGFTRCLTDTFGILWRLFAMIPANKDEVKESVKAKWPFPPHSIIGFE